MKFLDYIINRAKEPSTWRGLVGMAAGLGVVLEPQQSEAIVAAGLAVVGLINVFKKDAKSADAKAL